MIEMPAPTKGNSASGRAKTMPPATLLSSARQVKCAGQMQVHCSSQGQSPLGTKPNSRTITKAFLSSTISRKQRPSKRKHHSASLLAISCGGSTSRVVRPSHTTAGGHQDDTGGHPMPKAKVAVPAAHEVSDGVLTQSVSLLVKGWWRPIMKAVLRRCVRMITELMGEALVQQGLGDPHMQQNIIVKGEI